MKRERGERGEGYEEKGNKRKKGKARREGSEGEGEGYVEKGNKRKKGRREGERDRSNDLLEINRVIKF